MGNMKWTEIKEHFDYMLIMVIIQPEIWLFMNE